MNENPLDFYLEKLSADNIDEATTVRLNSWVDTYVNLELGITQEWIEKRNNEQLSERIRKLRLERLNNPRSTGWVAKDLNGKVIGVATPYRDDEGVQHVGSLYVDKNWHGKGVGGALMRKIIEWFDASKPIELGVVTYNERAKSFYHKWGFKEVPDSVSLFDNKIPEVNMVRPPNKSKHIDHN